MEKTVDVTKEVQKVYDRYMWLRSRLATRYHVYYDNCPTARGILAINAWHERFEKNLEKRFWREFTQAVEKAKKAEAEVVEA